MNIFYNTMHNTASLVMLVNTQTKITQKVKNGNHFYYDSTDQLVGFNIFLNKYITNLTPGRLAFTPELQTILMRYYPSLINWEPEFKVCIIQSCEPIPNTHLKTCIVDIDTKQLQIVCGAENARVGLKTVVACVGTIFVNGLNIQPTKLKGFDSYGMLCSQKELDLNEYNQVGIIELNDELQYGSTFKSAFKNLT